MASKSSSTNEAEDANPTEAQDAKRHAKAEEIKKKGNEAFKAKKYDEAIQLFTKAIKLVPDSYIYYGNRSATFTAKMLHIEKIDKMIQQRAIADAKKCVQINEKWPKGYVRHSTALMVYGDYVAAIRILKRGLINIPNDPLLTKNLNLNKEKLKVRDKEEGYRPKKDSGFRLFAEDKAGKARSKELKRLRKQFLEDTKQQEASMREKLLKEEGIILPKYNILGTPGQSGFEPFANVFKNPAIKRKRKRRRIKGRD